MIMKGWIKRTPPRIGKCRLMSFGGKYENGKRKKEENVKEREKRLKITRELKLKKKNKCERGGDKAKKGA